MASLQDSLTAAGIGAGQSLNTSTSPDATLPSVGNATALNNAGINGGSLNTSASPNEAQPFSSGFFQSVINAGHNAVVKYAANGNTGNQNLFPKTQVAKVKSLPTTASYKQNTGGTADGGGYAASAMGFFASRTSLRGNQSQFPNAPLVRVAPSTGPTANPSLWERIVTRPLLTASSAVGKVFTGLGSIALEGAN